MAIQEWSEQIVIVDLPEEPDAGDELNSVLQMVRENDEYNVIIDFAGVDIVTSSSISALLKLQKILHDSGRRLFFTDVSPATRNIFRVTGIEELFNFISDKFTALASLQMVQS
jgi:anti-anti-sigma factor